MVKTVFHKIVDVPQDVKDGFPSVDFRSGISDEKEIATWLPIPTKLARLPADGGEVKAAIALAITKCCQYACENGFRKIDPKVNIWMLQYLTPVINGGYKIIGYEEPWRSVIDCHITVCNK